MSENYTMNNIEFNVENNTLADLPIVMPSTRKLDADDYSASDILGSGETAFSSGNLNYLILQSQQSYELQGVDGVNDMLANSLDVREASDSNALPGQQANYLQSNLVNDTSPYSASLNNVLGGESSGLINSTLTSTPVLTDRPDLFGVAVGDSVGVNTQNAVNFDGFVNNEESTTINNFPPLPPEPPTPEPPTPEPPVTPQGPLLTVDTDTNLGETVDDVLDTVGDTVGDVTDTVGTVVDTVLSGDVSALPSVLVDEVVDTVGTVNGVVDTVQDTLGNVTGTVTDVLDDGLSLTNPVSNLDVVGDALSGILGTNTLSIGVDLRDVADVNVGVEFDEGLPDVTLSLDLPLLGMENPVVMSTDEVLDTLGVTQALESVDAAVESTLDATGLTPVVEMVEDGLGEVLSQVSSGVEGAGDMLENTVDGVQDGLTQTVETLADPLTQVTDGLGEVLQPVDALLEFVDEATEPVQDVVTNLVDGVGSIVGAILPLENNDPNDSDLTVLAGTDLGDNALLQNLDVGLDVVENIIGDVDVDLTALLSSPEQTDVDAVVDLELIDLNDGILSGDALGSAATDPTEILETVASGVEDGLTHTVAVAEDLVGDVLTGGLLTDLGESIIGATEKLLTGVGDNDGGLLSGGGLFGSLLGDGDTDSGDTDVTTDVDTNLAGINADLGDDIDINPVENLVGDVDLDVTGDVDTTNLENVDVGVSLGDTDISTAGVTDAIVGDTPLEPVIDNTLAQTGDGLDEVLTATSDTSSMVLDPVLDLTGNVLDGAETVTTPTLETVTDGVSSVLGSTENSSDSDLDVDLGIGSGDGSLGIVESISLDSVETVIGDVDISLDGDANLSDLDSLSLEAVADADLLSPLEGDEVVGDLLEGVNLGDDSLTDSLGDVLVGLDGDGSSLGDAFSGSTLLTDGSDIVTQNLSGGDELAEVSGSSGGGGLFGLF